MAATETHVCERVVTVHEGPDRFMRYTFTLTWCADYHPGHPDGEYRHATRGQVYRSELPRTGIDRWVDERKAGPLGGI